MSELAKHQVWKHKEGEYVGILSLGQMKEDYHSGKWCPSVTYISKHTFETYTRSKINFLKNFELQADSSFIPAHELDRWGFERVPE